MSITPYSQSYTHSCLVACFLMLQKEMYKVSFSREDEQNLFERGSSRIHPFYVVGVTQEFSNMFHRTIEVISDNAYFTAILAKTLKPTSQYIVQHQRLTISVVRSFLKTSPVICHIDNHILGDYSHTSHFIILEKELSNDRILVLDPWTGKRKRLSFLQLSQSIHSLRNHIKMCPLLLRFIS